MLWAQERGVTGVEQVTAATVRAYIVHLQEGLFTAAPLNKLGGSGSPGNALGVGRTAPEIRFTRQNRL